MFGRVLDHIGLFCVVFLCFLFSMGAHSLSTDVSALQNTDNHNIKVTASFHSFAPKIKITRVKLSDIKNLIYITGKCDPNLNVEINGSFLKKLGMDICKYVTTGESKVVNPGTYNTEVLIKGLDEATSKKIRLMRGI